MIRTQSEALKSREDKVREEQPGKREEKSKREEEDRYSLAGAVKQVGYLLSLTIAHYR